MFRRELLQLIGASSAAGLFPLARVIGTRDDPQRGQVIESEVYLCPGGVSQTGAYLISGFMVDIPKGSSCSVEIFLAPPGEADGFFSAPTQFYIHHDGHGVTLDMVRSSREGNILGAGAIDLRAFRHQEEPWGVWWPCITDLDSITLDLSEHAGKDTNIAVALWHSIHKENK